ncbi:MAG: Peptidoglycan glycosyltransferase [Desulfotomaculum sp. 46_296]|nr:MAG: Peptidoglycan glycosyltransferase [Desulfotomaculum sp. 46_296]HAU30791.1 stage V sporulation protein D [Desulfotomaculum sp.]
MVPAKNSFIPKRVTIVFLLVAFALFFLVSRLFLVQVVWGPSFKKQAEEYHTQNVIMQPERGSIYDRNHNELVTNVPAFSVYAEPNRIKDPAELSEKIAPVLGLKPVLVYQKLSNKEPFVWLTHNLEYSAADRLKKLNLHGIGLIQGDKRSYPQGSMAAHLLGFVGNDNQGLTGLEKSYDSYLRGKPGSSKVENDALGQPVPHVQTNVNPSSPGANLILTIDQTIQFFVERELDNLAAYYKPARVAIIVMDPASGQILAMGNRPTFNPGNWSKEPQSVWEGDTAVLYNYEPGSTFKMFIAAAALEEGVVSPGERFYDPGSLVVKGRRIYCWERKGHGSQSFTEAVGNSCNVVLMQVGQRLGKENLYKYLKGFGFGARTGIDLPGEESGVIRDKKEATELDLATMSIGQSIAVTPIQLITGACAIANGGKLMKPYLVKALEDDQGKVIKEFKPQVVRSIISGETARMLSSMMEKVVLEGTGTKAQVEGYRIAGKTGTAQVPGPKGYEEGKYIASFVGYGPLDNPRVAVLVLVDEPKGDQYYGGEIAAPAFQSVMRDTLVYLGIPQENSNDRKGQKELPEPGSVSSHVTVPNVIGFPAGQASQLIKERGLVCRASAPQGVISGQNPGGGSNLVKGSLVTLKVTPFDLSKPPAKITVPDLKGLTLKKAAVLLEELGLKLKAGGSGLALYQNPQAGTGVKPDSVVKVYFSPNK